MLIIILKSLDQFPLICLLPPSPEQFPRMPSTLLALIHSPSLLSTGWHAAVQLVTLASQGPRGWATAKPSQQSSWIYFQSVVVDNLYMYLEWVGGCGDSGEFQSELRQQVSRIMKHIYWMICRSSARNLREDRAEDLGNSPKIKLPWEANCFMVCRFVSEAGRAEI